MENNIDNRQDRNGEIEIDIMQILRVIWAKIWIVILSAIAMGLLALIGTEMLITPLYQSTAKLYIINRQTDGTTTINDIQSSTQLIRDYRVLVTSIPVVDQVISELDLEMSQDALIGEISCSIETDSRVLSITITDKDPYMAKRIADSLADVSAKQIPAVMQIEGVNIIEYGRIAAGPSSPNVKMNVLIGILAGLFIAIAIIVVRYLMDDSIKNAEDVENYLGLSTLALIPLTKEEYDGKKKNSRKKSKGRR